MESTNKSRTPSRCREWERQRRNKFNEAISKLGEVVKEINRASSLTNSDTENVQYPKIEIIQKAILCLKNCALEKTQLKAEILALQVKLERNKQNKKDASTQVYIEINKKSHNGKYVKLMMLQKSKRNALKEKSVQPNATVESKVGRRKPIAKDTQNSSIQSLPKLLPRSNLCSKKGPENTIVVLPATPYIFPQRPLLFPSAPPAIVLVDPNMQTLNKPIVNRNGSDVTRTTMVNILPITAYSRPLSATKNKKSSIKPKNDVSKKVNKKVKSPTKNVKDPTFNNVESKIEIDKVTESDERNTDKKDNIKDKKEESQINENSEIVKTSTTIVNISISKEDTNTNNVKNKSISSTSPNTEIKDTEINNIIKITKPSIIDLANNKITTTAELSLPVEKVLDNKNDKEVPSESINSSGEKVLNEDKENKLPNILESNLCENAVDGGNARLELAEELLAASPTAAFLMSFPLVSGNRADSPAEEAQQAVQTTKDNSQRRNEVTQQPSTYLEKTNNNDIKNKLTTKSQTPVLNKQNGQQKFSDNSKLAESKMSTSVTASTENPFLNLPMPSLITTACTLSDPTFALDFDCNTSKTVPSASSTYASNNNLFYKSGDPFNTVKSSIYSTSNISSGHEFNSLGLYPCAVEKYTSKNKSDYANVEDNLMKIGSSRLTYDIDLGWSHKSFDFVGCTTTTNTFSKENILTNTSTSYSSAYNPFNPEFHVSLVSSSNKRDISSKSNTFSDTIPTFYSQPTTMWTEDVPFYTNSNVSKTLSTKHQNYLPQNNMHTNINVKPSDTKQYEQKQLSGNIVDNVVKPSGVVGGQLITEKYTKKSPSKLHINWMTSEIRPMQNNCNSNQTDLKDIHKPSYNQLDHIAKKQDNEGNYFPISIHNFSGQTTSEEFQVWPSTRPLGTTEISIEPPPINLPTLVGDLALGPHDKKKNSDVLNRVIPQQTDIQNCGNFLSVTQLMNRSTDNMPSRYQGQNIEAAKSIPTKQSNTHFTNESNRKMSSRLDSNLSQPCYMFNEPKTVNSYDMNQFPHIKSKINKTEKNSKIQKNSYSAEALIRGGTCTQKIQDTNSNQKCTVPPQKYNDFNAPQDNSVAQVSHYPPLLDYSDNNYAAQQYSGTSLYNSTTNTISNSFYSNFMTGSSNLMASNYSSTHFSGDFIDYNQTAECNYTNQKYEEFKMRNNSTVFHQDKVASNYKSTRRESTAKHKLECSKKDSSKKYQSKRPKLNADAEEWSEASHLLWQNKTPTKRHSNLMSEELSFPNYVGNQMATQYQPDFFNSHLMSSAVPTVGHNVDRSLTAFPVTSRANFNLSTIFPEITMKVQS